MTEDGDTDTDAASTSGDVSPSGPRHRAPARSNSMSASDGPPVPPADVDGSAEPAAQVPSEVPTEPVTGSPWARYVARRRRRKAEKAAKPRRKAPWWELPALIVLAILIAIVVKTFVVQPFYIPSASMEQTLHGSDGKHDRILVNKVIYDFRDPHPGDIVVFNAPHGWDDEPVSKPPSNILLKGIRGFGQLIGFVPPDGEVLVKRVIATGGETVKGDTQGNVMVSEHGPDGPYRTLNEPYVYIGKESSTMRAFGPVTIPKGRLWVMGDHRSDSADSRYHCGPGGVDITDDSDCDPTGSTVPVDEVIGKAFVVAWPPSHWRTLGTPSTFKNAALAGAADVPALSSAAFVLPIFVLRRRRRRR